MTDKLQAAIQYLKDRNKYILTPGSTFRPTPPGTRVDIPRYDAVPSSHQPSPRSTSEPT